MDLLADSNDKLCKGGKDQYVGRDGVPLDNRHGEECEPVKVFDCLDISEGHLMLRTK